SESGDTRAGGHAGRECYGSDGNSHRDGSILRWFHSFESGSTQQGSSDFQYVNALDRISLLECSLFRSRNSCFEYVARSERGNQQAKHNSNPVLFAESVRIRAAGNVLSIL